MRVLRSGMQGVMPLACKPRSPRSHWALGKLSSKAAALMYSLTWPAVMKRLMGLPFALITACSLFTLPKRSERNSSQDRPRRRGALDEKLHAHWRQITLGRGPDRVARPCCGISLCLRIRPCRQLCPFQPG